ncbi:MAG: hypothetical protein EZS28_052243, partial [Streblomastix strix]
MDALDVGFKDDPKKETNNKKDDNEGKDSSGTESDDESTEEEEGNNAKDDKVAKNERKTRNNKRISDLTDEQKKQQDEQRERENKPVIPSVTAIREPGDYDPVYFADPEGMQAQGYQVRVDPETLQIQTNVPLEDNPYSNLRIGAGNKQKMFQKPQQRSREAQEWIKRSYSNLQALIQGPSVLGRRSSSSSLL